MNSVKRVFINLKKVIILFSFEKEVKDPEHHPFPTPSGKIELFSTKLWKTPMKDFMPPIPRYVAPAGRSGGPADKALSVAVIRLAQQMPHPYGP